MHLEMPQVPFASHAMDSIEQVPTTSKGNRFALTFICLLTSYLITVPLETKTSDEVSMAYMKEILPKTACSKFILQDNGTELKNEQLMSIFDTSGIKQIYSNPYSPKGNNRIKNVHSFLKRPIATFMHSSQLKWATSVNDLESPFYLVHGRDSLEGRLSNLQNYCRNVGDQSGQLVVQELRKIWKLNAKLIKENRTIDPVGNKRITKAINLKKGQLVFVKDHQKGTFNQTYTYDRRVSEILNDSTVMLTTPDGKCKGAECDAGTAVCFCL